MYQKRWSPNHPLAAAARSNVDPEGTTEGPAWPCSFFRFTFQLHVLPLHIHTPPSPRTWPSTCSLPQLFQIASCGPHRGKFTRQHRSCRPPKRQIGIGCLPIRFWPLSRLLLEHIGACWILLWRFLGLDWNVLLQQAGGWVTYVFDTLESPPVASCYDHRPLSSPLVQISVRLRRV